MHTEVKFLFFLQIVVSGSCALLHHVVLDFNCSLSCMKLQTSFYLIMNGDQSYARLLQFFSRLSSWSLTQMMNLTGDVGIPENLRAIRGGKSKNSNIESGNN